MSYPIMPALPLSMAKGLKKSPVYKTVVQRTAASRGNASTSLTPFPTWLFEFDLDKIQGNEAASASTVAQFMGTFMACGGQSGLFLFTDPQDNAVSLTNSGMLDVTSGSPTPMGTVGNGTSTKFQLARSIGGLAWDVVQNLNGSPVIKVGGVTKTAGSDYSISSTGVVTFVSAPGSLSPLVMPSLTWSGSFYFACRFDEDMLDMTRAFTTNSGTDLWDAGSIKFASELI